MATIETFCWPEPWRTAGLWPAVALQVRRWLGSRGLPLRDAVLLLPYAALLAPARAALAAAGGWQPRVETTLTLAAALGPPPPAVAGTCQGELTHDRLAAAALLRRLAWGSAWERSDAAGFAQLVARVVDAAQTLRSAALTRPPASRDDFWDLARSSAAAPAGPAATEALLLRVAVEWAAAGGPAATDRLFDHRPSAWISLQIGGPDPLADALLGHAETPSLRLVADPPADAPWPAPEATAEVERVLCDDFEAEAQAAASAVITALNEGRAPVALVALDRSSLRRIRALLERAAVPLLDETGWLLATTRAAASVVALLRAAQPDAGADARLDWLKTWPLAPPRAIDALEAEWRGRRHVPAREAGQRLWAEAQDHLEPLRRPGARPLAAWLDHLQELLARDGSFDRLGADAAGVQVLAALGWPAGAAWHGAAAELRVDLAGFIAWIESTLEATPFLPPPDLGAQVVLTPLARAFGRPFGHLVVPGADALHLGAVDAPPSLIPRAMAQALGLDDAESRRESQRLALSQVLRADRVTLLRRRRNDDEPLADSPDVEWLCLARARAQAPPWPVRDWQAATASLPAAPSAMPAPVVGDALPSEMSATLVQALRDCPYRFFARAVLRLAEDDELDAALAKRDFGNWLHAVLHRFHSERDFTVPPLPQLLAAADFITRELGLDAAELLPFRASFEHIVPAYLAWLAAREAQGWFWSDGESDHRVSPPALHGLTLRGRIDRLDHGPDGQRQLIDYKTGNATALKQKVRAPLDDIQLAFYAALLDADEHFSAAYLALDGAGAPLAIPQPGVHEHAQALLQGLGGEWFRLQHGAPLPALGESPTCDVCEARGLCRRDHWSPT